MKCVKCGADIADTAKFCGYCGNPVKVDSSNEVVNEVQPDVVTQEPVQQVQPDMTTQEPVQQVQTDIPTQDVQLESQNVVGDTVQQVQNAVEQPTPSYTVNDSNSSKGNKNNKGLFIALGCALAVIAVVLVSFALFKSNSNSVDALNKAVANLNSKGADSATIKLEANIEASEMGSVKLSLESKAAKVNDQYLVEVKLNKNIITDEISMFMSFDKDNAKVYVPSSFINLIAGDETDTIGNKWYNYTMSLSELGLNLSDLESESDTDFDFSSIIDQKHFVYVDSSNNSNHYQLKIDKELIEKIKTKASNELDAEDKEMLDSVDTSELDGMEPIILDFYITKDNQLEKISIDLAKYMDSEDVSKAEISISFVDLGSTVVTIPDEALNSKDSLEDYIGSMSSDDYSIEDYEF